MDIGLILGSFYTNPQAQIKKKVITLGVLKISTTTITKLTPNRNIGEEAVLKDIGRSRLKTSIQMLGMV
jgi:hypothetical protein